MYVSAVKKKRYERSALISLFHILLCIFGFQPYFPNGQDPEQGIVDFQSVCYIIVLCVKIANNS